MATAKLTSRQLNRATLARQMLLGRERASALEAVERLGGMQAQEARPPFIGLWSRLEGFRAGELEEALRSRQIVRGPLMRSTLHLAGAADFATFRPALQAAMDEAMKALGSRAKGLDLERVLPAARELLEAEPRDFNELRALLSERFPEMHERALGYSVRMKLPLVMVPTEDRWAFPRSARFALAESWLGTEISEEGSLEPLVLAYLAAFGPAGVADFQEWSNLRGAGEAFEALREKLTVFQGERGRSLYDLPDAPRPDESTPAPPRFLPEFDNLVLAHADRSRLIADEHRSRVVTKNLRVRATFLLDGMVRGTWSVERKRAKATLRLVPFEPLPKRAAAELAEEGERLLRFGEGDEATLDVKVEEP